VCSSLCGGTLAHLPRAFRQHWQCRGRRDSPSLASDYTAVKPPAVTAAGVKEKYEAPSETTLEAAHKGSSGRVMDLHQINAQLLQPRPGQELTEPGRCPGSFLPSLLRILQAAFCLMPVSTEGFAAQFRAFLFFSGDLVRLPPNEVKAERLGLWPVSRSLQVLKGNGSVSAQPRAENPSWCLQETGCLVLRTLAACVLSSPPSAEVQVLPQGRWSRWMPFGLVRCGGIFWTWARHSQRSPTQERCSQTQSAMAVPVAVSSHLVPFARGLAARVCSEDARDPCPASGSHLLPVSHPDTRCGARCGGKGGCASPISLVQPGARLSPEPRWVRADAGTRGSRL